MTYDALVLNADFRPLSIYPLSLINWRDAIKAVYEETHVVVAEYDRIVHSPSTQMFLPSVVAVKSYVPQPHRVAFTRQNIFLRDRFRCGYCGEEFAARDLRFDHVQPRSRGGQTTWANIVSSCEPCNTRKGNRLDMKPLKAPYEPSIAQLARAQRAHPPKHLHQSWLDFLYWDANLMP